MCINKMSVRVHDVCGDEFVCGWCTAVCACVSVWYVSVCLYVFARVCMSGAYV